MAFLTEAANRGSISTGYDIDNSCKFEPDNSEYLGKTPTSSGNRRTFTISMWIKRTEIGMDCYLLEAGDGDYNQSDRTLIKFDSDDKFRFGGGSAYQRITNRVFRDTSAWYHIVMAVDTTDSTAGNRLKLYVNGVQETSFGTSSDPSQNFEYAFCKDDEHTVGFNHTDNVSYYAGYMSEVILIDGQQLDPTSFGEFDEDSGIWKPIDVSNLTFGTNGFYLDFEDGSNLGNDASGGTDFTENNITSADQATDTPTNNFATLNPLHMYSGTASHNPSFVEGATRFRTERSGYWTNSIASMGITKGKWYFEAQPGTSNTHITSIGYGDESDINDWAQNQADTNGFCGETSTNSIGYLGSDTETTYGNVWTGTGSKSGAANSANYTISNIVGVAIDADNGYIYFAKDNTYINSGNPGSGASGTGGDTFEDTTTPRTGTVFPSVGGYHHTAATVINVNFGGYTTISISSAATDANGYGTFEYAPPSGYYALCTKNLAEYG